MITVCDALWDLYDENRVRTTQKLHRGETLPQGLYHLVVGAWVRNSKGQLLISQRHPSKNFPFFWECTGGSVQAGESGIDAATREVYEELGLVLNQSDAVLFHQTRRDEMQDFYDAWLFQSDVPITSLKLQATEVLEAKWVDMLTLYEMFLNNELHPKLDYIDKVIDMIK